ncbi:hypothetical protein ACGFIV_17940 [Sphaerisporangium sp. NPDC049003]|uniref:hypothetical protein n=1 Tax=Sphaerisporangium sp. NPDC049003 TaxID=3364517 RepID=UPI0037107600
MIATGLVAVLGVRAVVGPEGSVQRVDPGKKVGRIPKGQYRSVTVIRRLRGDSVTESESGETSDVWDRIEWNGGVGHRSDPPTRLRVAASPPRPCSNATTDQGAMS